MYIVFFSVAMHEIEIIISEQYAFNVFTYLSVANNFELWENTISSNVLYPCEWNVNTCPLLTKRPDLSFSVTGSQKDPTSFE